METLTRRQAAKALAVSETQIRVFEKTGQLTPMVLPSGKRLHSRDEVEHLAQRRRQAKQQRRDEADSELEDTGSEDAWSVRHQCERERRQLLAEEQTRKRELERHERRMRRLAERCAKQELDSIRATRPRGVARATTGSVLLDCLQVAAPVAAVVVLALLGSHGAAADTPE